MKKITSLLTLMLICCMSAFAQEVDLTKASMNIGGFVEEYSLDTWYLLYQRRGGDGYAHFEEPLRKRAVGFSGDPLSDGMKASQAENWLVKFVAGETTGTIMIQFANGKYWQAQGTDNGSQIKGVDNKYDATEWALYRVNGDGVDGAGNPVFSLNIGEKSGKRLDNNGNGGTLSMWDAGELTDVESNAAWSIASVTFDVLDEREAALIELKAIFATYSDYSGSFTTGTNPGEFGEAEVQAFENAIEAVADIDAIAGTLTAEQLLEMGETIKSTYDAVMASRVPFAATIAEGYYYITAALDFTETTTTEDEEDPETGEIIPGETITQHLTKAIYNDGTAGKWANLDEADANFLWKVVADGDKTYHLINCQTDQQFTKVTTSAAITLSEQSDSLVVFDAADVEGAFNIRLAAQAERDYFYIHCGGHGGGAGKNGNLVGWCNTADGGNPGASEWRLQSVDEATALAIIEACSPIKQIKAMTDSAAVIIAATPGMIEIAKDKIAEIDETTPLVKDASQFYSPMTTPDEQKIDGAVVEPEVTYGFLLDGNTNTYWHSSWEGGNVATGTHYIQISGINEACVAFKMTRRAVINDHITEASIYGFNEADEALAKEDGILLGTVSLPLGTNTETLTSGPIETQGCTVLRIYGDAMASTNGGTKDRGYWHMTEFQLYPATVSQPWPTTQAEQRAGEIAALESAITAWNAIDLTAVTSPAEIEDAFNALATAWNTFTKVYVNPAELREAVKNLPSTACIKIGTNPGEWANDASSAITALATEVNTYDASGLYTPEKTQELLDKISAAETDMFAAANKVQTGKWYRIRFGTEEEYEAAGWDTTPVKEVMNENAGAEVSHALYGKYVSVAKHDNEVDSYINDEGNEVKFTIYNVTELEENDATFGQNVAFLDEDHISNPDIALWQFVAIGDSAYVLQNKATGLYMRTGTTGAVITSVQPSTFNVSAIGYGKNLVKAVALTGENNNYLHAERSTNNLVTWNASTVESNSALYIEEAGDVTEAPSCEYTMSIWPGQVQTMCFPTSIEAKAGTIYQATIEGTTVTLNPVENNIVEAGAPFVYINGSVEDYEEIIDDEEDPDYNADAYVLATFAHGTEFVAEPIAYGALTGSFTSTTIGRGCMWAEGNTFVTTKKSSNGLGANTAYIADATEDVEATVTLIISENSVDGIQNAIANVNKTGNIYTTDGKLVGRGNLNALKGMNKGIYILNGVKIAVK